MLENNPHLSALYQKDLADDSKFSSLAFLMKLRRNRLRCCPSTRIPQSRRTIASSAKIINARARISHEYDHCSALDRRLTNLSLPVDYSRHAVDNNLALLPFLKAAPKLSEHRYELFLGATEQAWGASYLAQQNLGTRPRLGIHVGSGGTKNLALRRWPLDHYLELVRRLREKQPELAILFFGGPEEKRDHEKIQAAFGAQVFFPPTQSIPQAAALIGQCDSFLSVDTSLMHVAAAMRVKRQVVIETPTWNKPIEPHGNPFVLVKNAAVAGRNLDYYRYDGGDIKGTREELLRCMASVMVESVLEALTKAA